MSLYCNHFEYSKKDFDYFLMLKGQGGYTDSHVFLGLLMIKEKGCYDLTVLDEEMKYFVDYFTIVLDNEPFSDLYAEMVAFLYWGGYGDIIQVEWIDKIRDVQLDNLGWPSFEGSMQSDPHVTGFALLSIIYFEEGKDKQEFLF